DHSNCLAKTSICLPSSFFVTVLLGDCSIVILTVGTAKTINNIIGIIVYVSSNFIFPFTSIGKVSDFPGFSRYLMTKYVNKTNTTRKTSTIKEVLNEFKIALYFSILLLESKTVILLQPVIKNIEMKKRSFFITRASFLFYILNIAIKSNLPFLNVI